MSIILSLLIQCAVISSAGLFCSAYTHKSLSPEMKIIGLSQLSPVILLGFSGLFLTNTPIFIKLFYTILSSLMMLCILSLQLPKKESVHLTLLSTLIPVIIFIFIKTQPYLLTFYYNNILLTAVAIFLGGLAIFYVKKLALNRFFTVYWLMQFVAFVCVSINMNEWVLWISLGVIIASTLLGLYMITQDINQFYQTVHHEASYYKDQFEEAVEKEVKKRTFYVEMSKERMVELNRTDHLTKLLNRKSILADIDSLILDRNTTKFVLFIFDIDYFKQINDKLGHAKGDKCLKNLAAIIKNCIRDTDLAGRYGGDEFLLALPMMGYKEGIAFGERLLETVYKESEPRITISLGMSVYPWDGEDYKALFETADKGLYQAKAEGRNRIGYKGYIKI